MGLWSDLKSLDKGQKSAVTASFLGWTLDAFDFFIVVMTLDNIAGGLGESLKAVSYGITLTLLMRPLGAFIFGYLADRFGRRPVLMIDVALFSVVELATAASPNLTTFLILRAIFGVAMGGEWGVGAALVMESIPPKLRGTVSGFLQEGYATGFLLASLVFWLALPLVGWRGMFVIGALPAFLVLYIRSHVEESPAWQGTRPSTGDMLRSIARQWRLLLYVILVMSCFNAFSHGTQDLYAKGLLATELHLSAGTITLLVIVGNLGAIVGGVGFGSISERIGRRRAIVISSLLALPCIPLWAFSHSIVMLGLGVFLVQLCVQGAWGVVPTHLNELSPEEVRGTFPGFTYQLGNAVISLLAPFQIMLADRLGGSFSMALALTASVVAVLVAISVGLGTERRGASLVASAQKPSGIA